MSLIRFVGDETKHVYNISCDQIGGHVIRLGFNDDHPMPAEDILYSGFEVLNEYDPELVQGDMTSYIYFYRKYTNDSYVIELSEEDIPFDESTSMDNVLPDKEPEELEFSKLVELKLEELSTVCKHVIEYGLTIDGAHYSYRFEDQINLESVKNTVQLTGLPLGYHGNGQDCADYTAEQFLNIYIRLAMNKYCAQTYYNQTRSYLLSLEDTEENRETVINFSYGIGLPEPYNERYEHFVSLYEDQVAALRNIIAPSKPEEEVPDAGGDEEDVEESTDETTNKEETKDPTTSDENFEYVELPNIPEFPPEEEDFTGNVDESDPEEGEPTEETNDNALDGLGEEDFSNEEIFEETKEPMEEV